MTGAVMPIVRVAILTDSRLTELALPAELPLREILPAVERLVVPADANGEAEPAERMNRGRLSLAPIGGAPFSLDATLDTVGVADGDLLALQPVPTGPAAPGIVEDIADAAVIFSAARFKPWGAAHIQTGALAAIISVVVAGTGLSVTHRLITGAAAGLIAVSAVAVLNVLAALTVPELRTRVALSVSALVPMAGIFALLVPGKFGSAQVTLAAAAVAAWSLIAILLICREHEFAISVLTASTVLGAGLFLAAGAESVWQLPLSAVGSGLIVAALLVTIQAAQLSALWARFPLPVIPAPGDPTPSAPSLRVLEDLPRRVRISDAHQTGFIAGAVLLSVLGSVAVAWRPDTLSVAGWYVVVATAAAAALRARVWDSAACKGWLLAQPFVMGVVLLVLYTASRHYVAAVVVAFVLAVLALAWAVVALNPVIAAPESYSLPIRRLVGFAASGVDASLIPVIAYSVGLFSWVLNR
jgi:type VII secretion integral membrane protein EccD